MNIKRILNNIKVTDSGCWEWQKSCNSAGYGQLTENKVYWLAHRYSYQCAYGNVHDSEVIRHKCHNTKCCNPDHLISGTHSDNWYDSKSKHLSACQDRRSEWVVNGIHYPTIREANRDTGISMNSLVKYTNNGIFDVASYRKACAKANCIPKI